MIGNTSSLLLHIFILHACICWFKALLQFEASVKGTGFAVTGTEVANCIMAKQIKLRSHVMLQGSVEPQSIAMKTLSRKKNNQLRKQLILMNVLNTFKF